MSRAAADATRFTATSPHAFAKPTTSRLAAAKAASPRSNGPPPQQKRSIPGSSNKPGGPTETPAQKVARLRAAHAAKRASEISTWDRIVVRGRSVADSAHRITVMGLVILTVVAGGITTFSLGDMILYNRRKKREWYAEQHQKWLQALAIAKQAEASGTANDEQILLLNRERAAEMAEEERKHKKGVWKSIKAFFSSEGLKKEETPFGQEGVIKPPSAGGQPTPVPLPEVSDVQDSLNGSSSKSSILEAVEEKRRKGERLVERQGVEHGSLDKLAQNAVEAASSSSSTKSWSSWFGR